MTNQTVRAWDRELVPTTAGRTQAPDRECPVEAALAAISGRWTTLVVRELLHGPLWYSEFREHLPQLSEKVLSERLATLRRQGLVAREAGTGFPTRVRYRLTARGEALRPLLVELYRTGQMLQGTSVGRHELPERSRSRTSSPACGP